jgi:hypothetical protein
LNPVDEFDELGELSVNVSYENNIARVDHVAVDKSVGFHVGILKVGRSDAKGG